ncbi:unnamed protein product [Peronospora belbahrii]|uniref:Protein kinase domain-containing protein n=1 Tax=Peronospora belbahrii TaxID=622444 RepID=A0AAU9LI90_9STRA|nr:unnamed protein product [Peronospora belbahrii]
MTCFSSGPLGKYELSRLQKRRRIIDFEPEVSAEAFWSKEFQTQANAIRNEAVFDAFITPFISDVLHSCGMVFVNSERYQWLFQFPLVTKKTDFKPGGFATHRGMLRAKPTPSDGVQLVRYLRCPGFEAGSAVLADRSSFWLITSRHRDPAEVKKAKWVDKGSKVLFQNFISDNMSPWVAHLNKACISFGVDDVVEGDAYLGCGAYGRVFKVTRQDGEVCALKIVESIERHFREEMTWTKAQHTGSMIRLVRTQLHKIGLIHGDPRVPNVIIFEKKRLWINLVEVREKATPVLKEVNAEIFTRSILRVPRFNLLDPTLEQLIDNYGNNATHENINHLAKQVYQNLAADFYKP